MQPRATPTLRGCLLEVVDYCRRWIIVLKVLCTIVVVSHWVKECWIECWSELEETQLAADCLRRKFPTCMYSEFKPEVWFSEIVGGGLQESSTCNTLNAGLPSRIRPFVGRSSSRGSSAWTPCIDVDGQCLTVPKILVAVRLSPHLTTISTIISFDDMTFPFCFCQLFKVILKYGLTYAFEPFTCLRFEILYHCSRSESQVLYCFIVS